MKDTKYDVLIVGAGAAGCVVAAYIAENTELTIGLIEAGALDNDPLIHIPAGYAKILAHDRHVWKYETTPQHGSKRSLRQGKVLGGGSSINAMCYVRGRPADYERWQLAVGDTGRWSFDDILPHFVAQENNDTFHNKYHGVGGGLDVQLPRGINELNQRCLKAFQEFGLEYNPDYNGEKQAGVSPVQSTVGNSRRCNAADAYLRKHLASGRVTLLTHTEVSKILVEDGRAIGVQTIGSNAPIFANEVILSGGAIHSPRLLMLSGIGPRAHLEALGITVVKDAPDVGENLHDHAVIPLKVHVEGELGYQASAQGIGTLKAGLRYLATKDGPASGNGVETVSYFDPDDPSREEATVQCYHVPIISSDGLTPTGTQSGLTFEIVVLQPKSRGTVRLADSDPRSMPLIDPNYMGDAEDIRISVEAIRMVRKVIIQQSLASIVIDEVEPGPQLQSNDDIGEWIKKVATTMWHPVGTCRMGQDDRAVVDARLRVKGIEALRVIDASIIPNITSGNTNAPTQALARLGATLFVEDVR
jgi:choline dehydrogenase-like flavoprotein